MSGEGGGEALIGSPGCATLLQGESWRRPKLRPAGPATTRLLVQEDLASSPASPQPSPYLDLGFSQRKKKKKARPVSVFNLVTQVPRARAGTAPAREDEGGLPAGLFPHLCLGGLKRACGGVQSRGVVR